MRAAKWKNLKETHGGWDPETSLSIRVRSVLEVSGISGEQKGKKNRMGNQKSGKKGSLLGERHEEKGKVLGGGREVFGAQFGSAQ